MATALLGSFSQRAVPNFCSKGGSSEPANALSRFLDSKNIEMFLEEEDEEPFMGCMIDAKGMSLHASDKKHTAGRYEYRDLHADSIADMQSGVVSKLSILSILQSDVSRAKTCASFSRKAKNLAMSDAKFMDGVAVVVVDEDCIMLEGAAGEDFLRLPCISLDHFCSESDSAALEEGARRLLPSQESMRGCVHVDLQTGLFVDTEVSEGQLKHLHKRTFSRVFVVRGSAADVKGCSRFPRDQLEKLTEGQVYNYEGKQISAKTCSFLCAVRNVL